MSPEQSKKFISACITGKKILRFLPKPPSDLGPRHIVIIESCLKLKKQQPHVKISDIGQDLGITMPSITNSVNTLCELGYLKKYESLEDRRVSYIETTDKAVAIYENNVVKFHEYNSKVLESISDEECKQMVDTMNKIAKLMETNEKKLEWEEQYKCTKH